MLENKSSGAAWNGGTTVNVIEPASGQTYAVKFDRPDQIGILVKVTTNSASSAANIEQAIIDYFAGNIANFPMPGVGGDISTFDIAGAILAENPGYYLSKVEISIVSPISYATTPIEIGVNQIAVTQLSYISVVIV